MFRGVLTLKGIFELGVDTDWDRDRIKRVEPTTTTRCSMHKPELPRLLSTEEVAGFLGIAPHTLAVWRSDGRYELPFVKIGRAVRYRLEDVYTYLERRTRRDSAS